MSHGSGRVRHSTGTGIPGFTHKEHDFSRFWSENLFICACFLNYDEAIAVWHVKTVFYWEPITVDFKKHLIQYGMKGCAWAVMKSYEMD